ncbi:hypothetical protein Pcinc_025856 [Petrolisthes cinctipes]|uniref:Uncharacterized protein n=1 Tax=Petrolisthes cinctipes TaxID=88211 RepID=A0AAE1F9R5_PETCI|nr:hypothetical protein Pcinc_025856 [Petrolisthes cinctipes]
MQDQCYQAIIHALPNEVFSLLSPLLPTFNRPTIDDKFKAAIISTHGMTTEQYLSALEEVQQEGRSPSEVLRLMQQLNEKTSTPFNDDVLRIRHSKLLPIIIQLHLQALTNLTLHEYGKRADDLMSMYEDGAHGGPIATFFSRGAGASHYFGRSM